MQAAVFHRLHDIGHDPSVAAYGLEAADLLGVDPDRVYKTLVASVGGRLAVAVVPVSGDMGLKALAAALGAKTAEMADPAEAQRATGYVVGGISPLGHKRRLPTVIDSSIERWETVYVSAGRRGLELELAPADLVALTDAKLAPIGKTR